MQPQPKTKKTTHAQKQKQKKPKKGDRVNRYVEAEVLNHRMLRHPHVIEFKEVFVTSEYICIAMEYASGGSLFTYVQRAVRLKEAAARWFFQQLVIGLDYCHRRGVVNRDIKVCGVVLFVVFGVCVCVGVGAFSGVGPTTTTTATTTTTTATTTTNNTQQQQQQQLNNNNNNQPHDPFTHTHTTTAGEHAAADGAGPAAAAAQDLRLWLQQGALHERAQVQGWHARVHGARDHQGDRQLRRQQGRHLCAFLRLFAFGLVWFGLFACVCLFGGSSSVVFERCLELELFL
jgi:hypothetical protein